MASPAIDGGREGARGGPGSGSGSGSGLGRGGRASCSVARVRPSELLLADLAAIGRLATDLNVESDAADFDVGLSTDDMVG